MEHMHTGFEMFAFITLSAWIGLFLLRMFAAWMARQDGGIGSLGAALGGTL
jgi:hypothetical protein